MASAVIITPKFLSKKAKKRRKRRKEYQRLLWNEYWNRNAENPEFERLIRMPRQAFLNLVDLLRNDLQVDAKMASMRGGEISPEMAVFLTIRYLAGGTALDIKELLEISRATFYYVLKKTLLAICQCDELNITFPSTVQECVQLSLGFMNVSINDSITTCVGAIDGYLLSIDVPLRDMAGNVKAFFSGHYQRYGMNIQACCDSNCMFTYFQLCGPGSCNDRVAVRCTHGEDGSLFDKIEALPQDYVVIADAAYQATEHLIPMFYGLQRNNQLYDNFNYASSVCRARIEMSFGLMNTKWSILTRPLKQRLQNVKYVVHAIARLHNFVIKERLRNNESEWDRYSQYNVGYNPAVPNQNGQGVEYPLADADDPPNIYRDIGQSKQRHTMALLVQHCGVSRDRHRANAREVERQRNAGNQN